jgi:hypothetical protein
MMHFSQAVSELARGQIRELDRLDPLDCEVAINDYVEIVLLKKSSLFRCASTAAAQVIGHHQAINRVIRLMPIAFIFVLFPSRSSHESRAQLSTRWFSSPNTLLLAQPCFSGIMAWRFGASGICGIS